ncbi:MAG: IS1182 family transposase [Candidatus Competibacteraceae bacterium]|nr:IS1182 family transposase [Candidatus Competibacteraceae bacterium]
MVPVSLSEQLEPGTLEYAIHYVVSERLDVSSFVAKFDNDETGRPAYDPRILLKVVLLGYARGKISSRKIEAACRENIVFMALACGQCPDHSTIATFVSSMGEEQIASLFAQVLLVCEEQGLLGGTHFSLDGYKLSSNAAKEWSGTHADLAKKRDKLYELSRQAVRDHRRNDGGSGIGNAEARNKADKLKRQADRIDRFLTENSPKIGRTGKEVQSNVTDNESAKMKSSHGIIQGYNANAMVDSKHQIVVHAEAFGQGDDGAVAAPMLAGAQANLQAAGCAATLLEEAALSADTSYFTNQNLEAFQAGNINAYVPDPQFRKRDPRFADARRHRRPTDKRKQQYQTRKTKFTPDDFTYEEDTGKLICPAGKRLYSTGKSYTNPEGYTVDSFRASKADCQNCSLRNRCLKDPEQTTPRQVRLFNGKPTDTLTAKMKEKIDTPEGRKIYAQRLGTVEPVFANLAAQKGLNRSTLRGTRKVNIQWKLFTMIANLEKIARYGPGLN